MLHSLLKSTSKQLSEEYKFDQRVGWPELWIASVLVPEEQITLPACSVCKKRCHRKCQKCQLVFLYSKDCMTQIWSTHKQECKDANRTDNRAEVNLASVRPSPIRNGFGGSLAYGNAVAIAALSSQLPGTQQVAQSLFGASPPVDASLLAKAFKIDASLVQLLQRKFLG